MGITRDRSAAFANRIRAVAVTHQIRAVVAAMSTTRLDGYLAHCHPDQAAAVELYAWNSRVSAAFWETLGHLEIAVRNRLADKMLERHQLRGRSGSWLDDPHGELDTRARKEIAQARDRVRRNGKPIDDGQTIAELSFGFWRYLVARQYRTTLWPALAGGFPHAPDRALSTVEKPLARLHQFRNRLAHHEPVWNKNLRKHQEDIHALLGYIDPDLSAWVTGRCRVPAVLAGCPVRRPYP